MRKRWLGVLVIMTVLISLAGTMASAGEPTIKTRSQEITLEEFLEDAIEVVPLKPEERDYYINKKHLCFVETNEVALEETYTLVFVPHAIKLLSFIDAGEREYCQVIIKVVPSSGRSYFLVIPETNEEISGREVTLKAEITISAGFTDFQDFSNFMTEASSAMKQGKEISLRVKLRGTRHLIYEGRDKENHYFFHVIFFKV